MAVASVKASVSISAAVGIQAAVAGSRFTGNCRASVGRNVYEALEEPAPARKH